MKTAFARQRAKAAAKALQKVIDALEKWQHLYGIDNDQKAYARAGKSDLMRLMNDIERDEPAPAPPER